MKKIILLSSILTTIGLAILSTTSTSNASSSLPNDGNAGAPMDNAGQTCGNSLCHNVTATATTGVIFSDIPGTGYVGGSTYNFTVAMSGAAAYGFELTPQTSTSSTGLGTWIAGTGSAVSGKYIKQSAKKTGASANWTFQWTAPLTATTVTFYGAFNYANNNSTKTNDIIKTSSETYLANTTGIQENSVNKLSVLVFPNPTTEFLHIASDELYKTGEIYSVDGKLIKTISEQELISKTVSVVNIDNGSYFLNIKTQNKTLRAKFIKQN